MVAHRVGDRAEVFCYSGYGHVPFDPKLVAKPEGVNITEAARYTLLSAARGSL
jgi:hypothetical protein